jgi:hypothetical protein
MSLLSRLAKSIKVLQPHTCPCYVVRMSETRTRTIRVDDEVWAAIQALPGRTQNEAMRQLLIDTSKPSIDNRLDELRELILNLPLGTAQSEFRGSSEPTDARPKNAYCKHLARWSVFTDLAELDK